MTEQASAPRFDEWAILELMGHVRLGGKVSEQSLFGTALGRIDVPQADGSLVTQYFGGSSVYRLTPTTEEIARAVALQSAPEPVHRWELRALEAPRATPAPEACRGCGDADTALDAAGFCMRCDPDDD